ncbi:acetolactate synthase, partial [Burkholderia multivorans]|uniref:thiamine pyrophosphate-dependent enzyme n=1 Tax=Burkholderia multivorans TaxID=87883 RepID=UPI000DB28590
SSQVTYDGSVHALLAHTPDQLLYMPGFATLGYGIPAAIGAKVASPQRPVVCVLGDGAAMFSIQEVMTATELGLGIPFVIVDNGGEGEATEKQGAGGAGYLAPALPLPHLAPIWAPL